MSDDLLNVKAEDVTCIQELKKSESSVIFHVIVRGHECVMKVYHNKVISEACSTTTEHDIFICESVAYRRLKESGLCDMGFVPQFYGTVEKMQPRLWKPHIDMFLDDELLPNAVLMEYVPHMQMIDLSTYSAVRVQKLVNILKEIHKAKVLHHDPYPRNMMVVPGSSERVLKIDFDRAQTFSKPLTARQQSWFEDEVEMVDYLATALAEDHKKGELRKAWDYYFDGMSPDYWDRMVETGADKG